VPRDTHHPEKSLTLVLGGAQSGKSYYAQQLASRFRRVTFIATARPGDAEMRRKIARHRRERPAGWKTVEAPLALDQAIRSESESADVLLIDCLTIYVSNLMAARKSLRSDPQEHIHALCGAIQSAKASVIAVSNEVGSGVVPAYRSGRLFRELLGQMNQRVAQIADCVVLMFAGVPVTIKDLRANQTGRDLGGREFGDMQSAGFANGVRAKT
jgi:adenosylcobinamide kinase/adenosylcobinamide-phosphate guanylyltransferase